MNKDFKIIAIRPLPDCDSKYRKSLIAGEVYKFYNNYDIVYNNESARIRSITKQPHISESLYNLKNGINVNISAIVGKNGSGKSTLFDLLYLFIYLLSSDDDINKKSVIKKYQIDLGIRLRNLRLTYTEIEDFDVVESENQLKKVIDINSQYDLKVDLKLILNPELFLKKIKTELGNHIIRLELDYNKEKEAEEEMQQGFSLSVIYQINSSIYELIYRKNTFLYVAYENGQRINLDFEKDFALKNFFYNVCLNYSHHSLNSEISGKWIMKLFHKNDGYITPVVINPMRDEGSFNINTEIGLSKERMMINIIHALVRDDKFLLLDKYEITDFIFTPKRLRPILSNDGNNKIEDFKSDFLLKSIIDDSQLDTLEYYKDVALGYLEDKIPKIKRNYKKIIFEEGKENEELFQKFLKEDTSHIAKKVRQTLEFLKMTNTEMKQQYWEVPNKTVVKEIEVNKYIEWMKLSVPHIKSLTPLQLIEFAHPGFFSVDFKLKALNGDEVIFGDLSSGEQQMIYNENTILYHLFNLQSVHNVSNRVKYKNVNIILDEVELYYHPEMQRDLIRSLVSSFENIRTDSESGIESVNILLCTHSPFILSDIPNNNVLRLNKGEIYNDVRLKSFGANIYDILANDFFMENSYMGSMAKEKINEVIQWLNFKKNLKEIAYIETLENTKLNSLKIKVCKEKINSLPKTVHIMDSNYAQRLIQIIDEPLLKNTIQEMYLNIFPSDKSRLKN